MTLTLPDTMRTAALDGFGGTERFSLATLPLPTVGPRDVLIRVEIAGVGSWDATEREGQFDGAFGMPSTFPYVLGWDGAGTVAAVGDQVDRFEMGDRVYAASMPLPRGGFYAEYAVVEAEYVSRIPAGLPIEQAGVMPWDALTALSGLDTLDLKPGHTLMVFGASGGIGHMAVQFARQIGARVLAVASGDDGVALSQRLGAEVAIDGRRDDVVAAARDFAPAGVDAALVTVGGAAVDRALSALREGAGVACPHGVSPEPRVAGGRQLHIYNGDRERAATDRLNQRIGTGPFAVHIARVFALEDVVEAHRALESHYLGKLAMRVAT